MVRAATACCVVGTAAACPKGVSERRASSFDEGSFEKPISLPIDIGCFLSTNGSPIKNVSVRRECLRASGEAISADGRYQICSSFPEFAFGWVGFGVALCPSASTSLS